MAWFGSSEEDLGSAGAGDGGVALSLCVSFLPCEEKSKQAAGSDPWDTGNIKRAGLSFRPTGTPLSHLGPAPFTSPLFLFFSLEGTSASLVHNSVRFPFQRQQPAAAARSAGQKHQQCPRALREPHDWRKFPRRRHGAGSSNYQGMLLLPFLPQLYFEGKPNRWPSVQSKSMGVGSDPNNWASSLPPGGEG